VTKNVQEMTEINESLRFHYNPNGYYNGPVMTLFEGYLVSTVHNVALPRDARFQIERKPLRFISWLGELFMLYLSLKTTQRDEQQINGYTGKYVLHIYRAISNITRAFVITLLENRFSFPTYRIGEYLALLLVISCNEGKASEVTHNLCYWMRVEIIYNLKSEGVGADWYAVILQTMTEFLKANAEGNEEMVLGIMKMFLEHTVNPLTLLFQEEQDKT